MLHGCTPTGLYPLTFLLWQPQIWKSVKSPRAEVLMLCFPSMTSKQGRLLGKPLFWHCTKTIWYEGHHDSWGRFQADEAEKTCYGSRVSLVQLQVLEPTLRKNRVALRRSVAEESQVWSMKCHADILLKDLARSTHVTCSRRCPWAQPLQDNCHGSVKPARTNENPGSRALLCLDSSDSDHL